VDDFFQDYPSNIRNTTLSSIASGIFPTLGFLGTFISIALSMPDFTAGTTQALESVITVLLGGVGTAFNVSIYGIFLSICCIFFEK
ncbi:MotA/TolQ/ExbB proton channel family protein, partial [Aliarcobacter butzleri]